ncbi:MAG: hemerythrin domain-containing protein [Pseudomonadota bacterium]
MTHDLESRDGLPDALTYLLRDYPRDMWAKHENFGGLVQFWLDRHLMFRRLLEAMRDELERALDGNLEPRMLGIRVSRYASLFVRELHGHHTIEDTTYFPKLVALEPSLERGFDILDRDHKDLDAHLDSFTDHVNRLLVAVDNQDEWRRAAEGLCGDLQRFGGFLERHLVDEEDLIVPVLLKHASDSVG